MKGKNSQKNLLQLFIKDKRAFSLVEILVTMVILVAVFVSAILIFSSITLRISRQSIKKTISTEADDFILFLRSKLRESTINDIEGPFRIDFVGTETSIKFVAPYTEGNGSDLGKYGIYFDGDEIRLSLERIDRNTKSYSFESGFSGSQPMVNNVKNLIFSYWNGRQWEKNWDTKNQIGQSMLPEKIKIFLVLTGGKIEGEQIEETFMQEIWIGE